MSLTYINPNKRLDEVLKQINKKTEKFNLDLNVSEYSSDKITLEKDSIFIFLSVTKNNLLKVDDRYEQNKEILFTNDCDAINFIVDYFVTNIENKTKVLKEEPINREINKFIKESRAQVINGEFIFVLAGGRLDVRTSSCNDKLKFSTKQYDGTISDRDIRIQTPGGYIVIAITGKTIRIESVDLQSCILKISYYDEDTLELNYAGKNKCKN